MANHMMKEEHILFPLIRQLETGAETTLRLCGTIAGPINQMEAEHADAGIALARLNSLTDGYTPPEWACNTYRALLDGLQRFEFDLHQHVHKENNVLFPRALELHSRHETVS
jgi:regulator of cell morphogenesis and NO signaling